jgi:hypothetical protein
LLFAVNVVFGYVWMEVLVTLFIQTHVLVWC